MSLKNKNIVITSGPTWVPIDDVRVISNLSSGEMGRLIADKLIQKGAKVTLVEGQVYGDKPLKSGKLIKFNTLNSFVKSLNKQLTNDVDVVIHAAAVADYAPKTVKKSKISSNLPEITLKLVKTPKIINTIKKRAKNAVLVGFKLQSTMTKKDAVSATRKLFQEAGCDVVVANAKMRSSYKAYLVDAGGVITPALDSKQKVVMQVIRYLEKIS